MKMRLFDADEDPQACRKSSVLQVDDAGTGRSFHQAVVSNRRATQLVREVRVRVRLG